MHLRDATPDDVPALVALINAAYEPIDWWIFEHERTSEERLPQELGDPQTQSIVAELDGRVVGHVALTLHPGEPDLGLVATAPEAQGRGIATLLIAEAERRARAAGETSMHLHCIRENGLVAYYASLGYREAGEERSRAWGARRDFTMVHMTKEL